MSPRLKVRADRHGVHLFDRTTGVNVLIDEVTPPRECWARAPRYVSMALTNACELRCPFCYAPKTPGRLEPDAVVRWVRELDSAGCLGVGFGGGEPTAHPDFADICGQVSAETSLALTMTTHAHRIDERLADALRGALHFIRVSVDAVGDDYERIRSRSFDALRARIDTVASISSFGINMVVGDDTLHQLDPVAAFAASCGAAELLLLPQQPVPAKAGLTPAGAAQLAVWVRRYHGPLRLAISRLGTPDGLPLADPFSLAEDSLRAHAHVDAAGYLRSDAYSLERVVIGDSILDAADALQERVS